MMRPKRELFIPHFFFFCFWIRPAPDWILRRGGAEMSPPSAGVYTINDNDTLSNARGRFIRNVPRLACDGEGG